MDSKKNQNKKSSPSTFNGIVKTKPKSLRPMRSIVAVRSLKSKIQTTKFGFNIVSESIKDVF